MINVQIQEKKVGGKFVFAAFKVIEDTPMLVLIVNQSLEGLILLLVRQGKPNAAFVGEFVNSHLVVAPSWNVLLQVASI